MHGGSNGSPITGSPITIEISLDGRAWRTGPPRADNCQDGHVPNPPQTHGQIPMSGNSFNLGDMMQVIGAETAKAMQIVGNNLAMASARLDAAAQKSLFEVDANETGMTNANFPRPVGGSSGGQQQGN
jgi:hypothetical protein